MIMNNKGLTLIEIILSVVIIIIVATGILSAYFGGRELMDFSRHRLQAFNFTREALDILRSNAGCHYDSLAMTEGNHTEADIGGNIIRGEMKQSDFGTDLTYNVSYDAAGANPDGYKKVVVTVNWDEREPY